MNIDNVEPIEQNVLNATYPISRSLFVVTPGNPVSGTFEKVFIDFLLSNEGQGLVEEAKDIPIN